VAKVRTIPIVLGTGYAKWILHLLNLAILLLIVYGIASGRYPFVFYVMLLHFFVVLVFIEWYFRQSDKQFGSHFYLFIAMLIVAIAFAADYSFFNHS
jgi:4-hydroxybenzoate polyprenyltransferase